MKRFLVAAIVSVWSPLAFADCRVIEYPDHNEIDCSGKPLSPEELAAFESQRLEREKAETELAQKAQKEQAAMLREYKKTADMTIDISNMDSRLIVNSYGYKTYSFKFDAHNPGCTRMVLFDIVIFDSSGFELDRTPVNSLLTANSTSTITATMMTKNHMYKWMIRYGNMACK